MTLLRFLPSPPAKVFSVQPKIPGQKTPRLLQLRLQFSATWNTGARDPSFPFPDQRKLNCLVDLSILHFPSLYVLYRPFHNPTLLPRLFWGVSVCFLRPHPLPHLLLPTLPSAPPPGPALYSRPASLVAPSPVLVPATPALEPWGVGWGPWPREKAIARGQLPPRALSPRARAAPPPRPPRARLPPSPPPGDVRVPARLKTPRRGGGGGGGGGRGGKGGGGGGGEEQEEEQRRARATTAGPERGAPGIERAPGCPGTPLAPGRRGRWWRRRALGGWRGARTRRCWRRSWCCCCRRWWCGISAAWTPGLESSGARGQRREQRSSSSSSPRPRAGSAGTWLPICPQPAEDLEAEPAEEEHGEAAPEEPAHSSLPAAGH